MSSYVPEPQNNDFKAPNNCSSYAKYQNFAPSINEALETSPVDYSIFNDIDSYFAIGPLGSSFGPLTDSSQAFMSEKCSKNWDGSCEFLSRNITPCLQNRATVSSNVFKCTDMNMTAGDYLVFNSAQRRFGRKEIDNKCTAIPQLYNPLDPKSPEIVNYACGLNYLKLTPPPPSVVDKDEIMNKMLNQPQKFVSILKNMYMNLNMYERDAYKHTRLGNCFQIFDAYIKVYGSLDN